MNSFHNLGFHLHNEIFGLFFNLGIVRFAKNWQKTLIFYQKWQNIMINHVQNEIRVRFKCHHLSVTNMAKWEITPDGWKMLFFMEKSTEKRYDRFAGHFQRVKIYDQLIWVRSNYPDQDPRIVLSSVKDRTFCDDHNAGWTGSYRGMI